MSTIVTRAGKGAPLSNTEMDANFINLNTDKVEKTAAAITGGSINGTTIGATTASTGKFTTLDSSSTTILNGTTIPASKTLLVSTDIGTSVQAYDATILKSANIGSTVQAYDADLTTIASLSPANGNVIKGNGTAWDSLPIQTLLTILNRSSATINIALANAFLPVLNRAGSTINVVTS